jgi:hypothetical protein
MRGCSGQRPGVPAHLLGATVDDGHSARHGRLVLALAAGEPDPRARGRDGQQARAAPLGAPDLPAGTVSRAADHGKRHVADRARNLARRTGQELHADVLLGQPGAALFDELHRPDLLRGGHHPGEGRQHLSHFADDAADQRADRAGLAFQPYFFRVGAAAVGLADLLHHDDLRRGDNGRDFSELRPGGVHRITDRLDCDRDQLRESGHPPHDFRVLRRDRDLPAGGLVAGTVALRAARRGAAGHVSGRNADELAGATASVSVAAGRHWQDARPGARTRLSLWLAVALAAGVSAIRLHAADRAGIGRHGDRQPRFRPGGSAPGRGDAGQPGARRLRAGGGRRAAPPADARRSGGCSSSAAWRAVYCC